MKELILLGLIALLVFGCIGAQSLDKKPDLISNKISETPEQEPALPDFEEELYSVEEIDYSGLEISDSDLSAPD